MKPMIQDACSGSLPQSEGAPKRPATHAVGKALFCIAAVLFVVTAAILVILSGWYTARFNHWYSELVTLISWRTRFAAMLVGFCAFIALSALSLAVCRRASRLDERLVLTAVLVITTFVGMWIVLSARTGAHEFPDAESLIAYASDAACGHWDTFIPGAEPFSPSVPSAYVYFTWYPYQIGCFLYFLMVFRTCGVGNVLALEIINVIANEVTIAALTGTSCCASDSKACRVLTPVLLGMSLPLHLSAAFPYGNALGLSLACVFLYLQARAIKEAGVKRSMVFQLISLVALAAALVVKSTYILIAIGACAAWIVFALRDGRWSGLVAVVAVVLVAHAVAGLPIRAFENSVGQDYGEGFPTIDWFEIGLTESSALEGQAGWWDDAAITGWNETGGDIAAQRDRAERSVSERLSRFADDPRYAFDFFRLKIATEWTEPTYQTVMYYGNNMDVQGNQTDVSWLVKPEISAYLKGFQLLIYIGALVEAANVFRRREQSPADVAFMLYCCIDAGFACYVIWEAKSAYVLAFAILLIPLTAAGIASVEERLCSRAMRAD